MRPVSRSSSARSLRYSSTSSRERGQICRKWILRRCSGCFSSRRAIGLEALRQALGIVHAVDADRERAAGQAAGHPLHQLVVGGALGVVARRPRHRCRSDRRRRASSGRSAAPIRPRPWRRACAGRSRGSRAHAPRSGSRPGRRRRDRRSARAPTGIASIIDGGTNGTCRKKPSGPWKPLLAQHAAERDQVIVVRPHRVVGLQHGGRATRRRSALTDR